ncbi:MAG: hypothetical protein Kow0020_02420 [Wenzhouxiangellaceae bacterium]
MRWNSAFAAGLLLLGLNLLPPTAFSGDTIDQDLARCRQLEHGEPAEALALATRLREDLRGREETGRMITAVGCAAWAQAMLGNHPAAEADVEELLTLFEQLDEAVEQVAALRAASAVYQRINRIEEAAALLGRALTISIDAELLRDQPGLYTNLGILHAQAEQHERATEYLRRALATSDPETDVALRLAIRYNLGLVLRSSGQPDEAYAIFLDLVDELDQPGMEIRLASVYSVLGSLSREQAHLDTAREWLQKSEQLHRGLDNPAELTALLIEWASLELAQNRIEDALRRSAQAVSAARRAAYTPGLIGALEVRGEVLESARRYRDALEVLREQTALQQSYAAQRFSGRLADLEAGLAREVQARELAESRARELALERRELWQRRWLLFGISVLLVLTLVLIWQRRNLRAVRRASHTDQLTGLSNRRGMTLRLAQPIPEQRHSSAGLMLIDLDEFKKINDRFGHAGGDRLLRETSRMLERETRAFGGHVARWGGEEFLVFIKDVDGSTMLRLASRLAEAQRSMRIPCPDGRIMQATMSMGFAPLAPGGSGGEQAWERAIRLADHLLYLAKRAARDRWYGVWGPRAADATEPETLDELVREGRIRLYSDR